MHNVIARNSIVGLVLDTMVTEERMGFRGKTENHEVEVATLRVPRHNVAQIARAALIEATQQGLADSELRNLVKELAAHFEVYP